MEELLKKYDDGCQRGVVGDHAASHRCCLTWADASNICLIIEFEVAVCSVASEIQLVRYYAGRGER